MRFLIPIFNRLCEHCFLSRLSCVSRIHKFSTMADYKDGLNFPDLTPVDHARHCQQYTSVLNRNNEDTVTLDEIDNLQLDLETLLVAATRRMRQLQAEVQSLSDGGDGKKDNKKKENEAKRLKHSDERPSKKVKCSDSPAHAKGFPGSSSGTPTSNRSKAKSSTPRPNDYVLPEEHQSALSARVPINDAPNRFWQSIEPYCAPITHENVRMLEQMCQASEDEAEYFKVPELGVHFSQRWTVEDMREEKSEGNRANVKGFDKRDANVETVMKKVADSMEANQHDVCPFGSLTQRLVSSFVEENIISPPEHAAGLLEGKAGDGFASQCLASENALSSLKSSKSLQQALKLESRLHAELIEQGILEPETAESRREDEVLSELRSCQQELAAVTRRNRDVLGQLLIAAKEELKKQEVRKKIDVVNTEVMEHYRRVTAARQKKRTLTKKEKDATWKALRDREALVKQLD